MQPIRDMSTLESLFRKKYAHRVFKALFRRFGTDVEVIREQNISSASVFNVEDDSSELSNAALSVFGNYSGVSPAKPNPVIDEDPTQDVKFQARIVIAVFPRNPFDAAATGFLEQQVIFSAEDLQPLDKLVLRSEDDSIKMGIVGDRFKYGNTDEVYKCWTYNNLGGETT